MNDVLQDDILFDRLVDGELSPSERQRLLSSLDDRPGAWRKCALAFLEAQAWRGELKQIVRDSDTVPSTVRAGASGAARNGARGLRLLAMAACVLMAFTLGLAMRGDGLSRPGVAPNPGEQIAEAASPLASPPGTTNVDDALTFWVRNEQGEAQPIRVPLVDAEMLDRQFGVEFQPALSDAARDHLQRRGYAVHSKQRYAPLLLENGRPMIVPVEDTRIVPISRPVY